MVAFPLSNYHFSLHHCSQDDEHLTAIKCQRRKLADPWRMTCDWMHFSKSGHPLWHSINRVKTHYFSNKFEKGKNPGQFGFCWFSPFSPFICFFTNQLNAWHTSASKDAHPSALQPQERQPKEKLLNFCLKSTCPPSLGVWRVPSGQGQPRRREPTPPRCRAVLLPANGITETRRHIYSTWKFSKIF